MSGDRIVPLPSCAHVHPRTAAGWGPCDLCGVPFRPTVLTCVDCGARFPAGQECPTPRCLERSAALVAEWIAHGLFDGIDGEPS